MKKKWIPICVLLLILAATILTFSWMFLSEGWSRGVPPAPISLLMGVAAALLLYQTVQECPKGEKGRTSLIVMLGISMIASTVFLILWILG